MGRLKLRVLKPRWTPTPSPGPGPTPSAWPNLSVSATRLTSGAQTQRTAIINKIDTEEWRPNLSAITGLTLTASGANEQAIINDVRDKIFTCMSDNPNALHEIRIPAGTYGPTASFQDKEFGFGQRPAFGATGGVVITRVPGDTVILLNQWAVACDGLVFKDLTFARASNTSAGPISGSDQQILIESSATVQARVVITGNRFGAYWHPTNSGFAQSDSWSRAIQCNHARQLTVYNNEFRRCHYQIICNNARIHHCYQNRFSEVVQVCHYIHCQTDGDTTGSFKGRFDDDNTYYWFHHELHLGTVDAVEIIGTPHVDYIQNQRMQNDIRAAVPKSIPGDMKLLAENFINFTDISGAAPEGPVDGVVPSINTIIDSDTSSEDPYERPNCVFLLHGFILTGTGFVAQLGPTQNYVENFSATSSPQVPEDWNAGVLRNAAGNILQTNGGTITINRGIFRNLDGLTSSPPTNSAFVNDNGTNTSPGNRPQDFFEGTFTQSPTNLMWIFSLPNALSLSDAAFAGAIISQFTPKAGVSGGAVFL